MKRTGSFGRRVGIKRRARLARIGQRGRASMAAMRVLRPLLWKRCGGFCECCGSVLKPKRWDPHHIHMKSQGGPDRLDNLMAVHRWPCHKFIHANPIISKSNGWLKPTSD